MTHRLFQSLELGYRHFGQLTGCDIGEPIFNAVWLSLRLCPVYRQFNNDNVCCILPDRITTPRQHRLPAVPFPATTTPHFDWSHRQHPDKENRRAVFVLACFPGPVLFIINALVWRRGQPLLPLPASSADELPASVE